MTVTETAELLANAADSYPGRCPTFTPAIIATWAGHLEDVPLAVAMALLSEHVRTSRYFPAICDVRPRDAGWTPPLYVAPPPVVMSAEDRQYIADTLRKLGENP